MIICFLLFTLISLTGCATTIVRLESDPNLYPATQFDIKGAVDYCNNKDPIGGLRWGAGYSRPNIFQKFLWVTFVTIDLPISIVTDTLIFPIDIYYYQKRKKLQPKDSQDGVPPPEI